MPRPILSTQSDSTVLSLFPAGGITRSQDWLDIADASRELADSSIYLTSHSSLELAARAIFLMVTLSLNVWPPLPCTLRRAAWLRPR